MLNSKPRWEYIKTLKVGGQAKILLYRDLNDSTNRLYVGKQALEPQYADYIKKEHKLLKKIIQNGFQHAVYEDKTGPGGYTSYRRYYEGYPLDEVLEKTPGKFIEGDGSEDDFLNFAYNIIQIVRTLHKDHSLVHRDIKPANIIYGDYNSIALIDLGIALPIHEKGRGEHTDGWSPPEQKIVGTEADYSHDIYSLGKVLLYSLQLSVSPKGLLVPMNGFDKPYWLKGNEACQKIIKICTHCVIKPLSSRPKIEEMFTVVKKARKAGDRKKKIYENCPNPKCDAPTFPSSPVCYSCLTPLIFESPSGICAGCGREIPLKQLTRHYEQTHPDLGPIRKGEFHPRGNSNNPVYACPNCRWSTMEADLWLLHENVCKNNDSILSSGTLRLVDDHPFSYAKSIDDNPRAFLALSQAGLRFETLEVYRSLNIHPYDHQEDTVLRALRDLGGRCIIADGVGLGKTIECGIILRELLYRDLIKSALIIVPNYELQMQWLDELEDKFQLGPNDPRGFNTWDHHDPPPKPGDRLIIDLKKLDSNKLSSETSQFILEERRDPDELSVYKLFVNQDISWDVIIIDEAHELGIDFKGLRWKRIIQMDSRFLFLVTATPMKKSPIDLYPLIHAVNPILSGEFWNFRRDYGINSSIQDYNKLKALLNQVMIRHTRNDVHSISFPRRKAITDFAELTDVGKFIYKYLKIMIHSDNQKSKKMSLKLFSIFQRSITELLDKILDNAITDLEELEAILTDDSKQAWKNIKNIAKVTRSTPENRDEKINVLIKIVENYWNMGTIRDSDSNSIINADNSPIIVFAGSNYARDQYRDVLIRKFGQNHRIGGFHDSMTGLQRQKMLEAFNRGEIDLLVCGTSQSRGLNLQIGSILINMDLPSSPVEIEQRIGRVERLNQKKPKVFIVNIMYDTKEEKLRWDLYSKHLMMFQEVLGDIDLVNLFTAVDIVNKVEEINNSIIEGLRTEQEYEEQFRKLKQELDEVRSIHNQSLRKESDDDDLI